MEYRKKSGTSVEGHRYEILMEFENDAPDGALPVRVVCLYLADDGKGFVGIERPKTACINAVMSPKPAPILAICCLG